MDWQCHLRFHDRNPGTIDGQLATQAWEVAQKHFKNRGHEAGAVGGVVVKTRRLLGVDQSCATTATGAVA